MTEPRPAAEQACRDLMARYCVFVDARRHAELAALFAPEGELQIAGRMLRGRAAIQAFFDERTPSLSVHLHGSEWVDADPASGQAIGGSSAAVYRIAGDPAMLPLPQLLATAPVLARYEDRFVAGSDGWRFALRRALPVFVPA